MKKILSSSLIIGLTVFPLLSLKSGSQSRPEKDIWIMQNKEIKAEIDSLTTQINLLDEQIKFKDSLDNGYVPVVDSLLWP